MTKELMAALVCFSLAGCATTYQPYSYFGGGGYRDIQLADNVFGVTVEANGYTSSARASDLALLRSAELALKHGFNYFVIEEIADNSYSTSYVTPQAATVNVRSYGNVAYGTAESHGGQIHNFRFPTPSITISAFNEKPALQGIIYDAKMVSQSLRQALGVK